MILIETCDRTQRCMDIAMSAELMFADTLVGIVDIDISRFGVSIQMSKIINKDKLPYPVKSLRLTLVDWFINRGLMRQTHRNIFFTELALDLENRDLSMPFVLSLSLNSISLVDKYWINPLKNNSFIINGAHVNFTRTTWMQINPFVILHSPYQIDQYGLCDQFLFPKQNPISSLSLIWTINGEQNKKWTFNLRNNRYVLEKKLNAQQLEVEIDTFNFFANTDIIVPEYSYTIEQLDEADMHIKNCYNNETIAEGLHIIKKACLTSSDSYLVPLIDFVCDDDNIHDAVLRMCNNYVVNPTLIQSFLVAIKQYQDVFNVSDFCLDTRNMGLLVSETNIQFAVWSRLILDKRETFA